MVAAITGRGVVSSLGSDVATFEQAVLAGKSSIRKIGKYPPARLKFTNGAPITDFDATKHFDARTLAGLDRFAQFAAVAGRQAWAESGLTMKDVAPERVGVIIGTSNVGGDILEQGWRRMFEFHKLPMPLTIPMAMANAPASRIAREIGARGPVFAIGSACASAAHAILISAQLLESGVCDVMIAGGAESCFMGGFLQMWDVLRVVSPEVCRPFSAGRLGLTIGEGAGVIVLERSEFAKARGAKQIATLAGAAMNCDAGDLTSPDQHGMKRAMAEAIRNAGLSAADIGYVNAHGTGTVANDKLEASAIRETFGKLADRLPVSSSKSSFGHSMGASGALELIVTIAALRNGVAPPTLNFLKPDPECPIDAVPEGPRKAKINAALSNSFAFGGLNVCLAITAAGAAPKRPRPAVRRS
jgi:nodulation protein E